MRNVYVLSSPSSACACRKRRGSVEHGLPDIKDLQPIVASLVAEVKGTAYRLRSHNLSPVLKAVHFDFIPTTFILSPSWKALPFHCVPATFLLSGRRCIALRHADHGGGRQP